MGSFGGPQFETTGDIVSARRTVMASRSLLIEDSALSSRQPIGKGYSPSTQVVFPYFGAFSWRTRSTESLLDTNAVLFVTGGQEFFERHPIARLGHGSAILTPSDKLLDELAPDRRRMEATQRPMSNRARLMLHALLFSKTLAPLEREELAVSLLIETMRETERSNGPARPVVERAKQVLHAHAHEVLSLDFVAQATGVSPIYLTQLFVKSEGVPLYRYQMQLRLARALVELPRSESLSELAISLGFSSHSHFTMAFRNAFGVTPSEIRGRRTAASNLRSNPRARRSNGHSYQRSRPAQPSPTASGEFRHVHVRKEGDPT